MSNPPHARRFRAVRARQALYDTIRAYLRGEGFDEVETPLLVPCPSMEPHINAFETRFEPEMGAPAGERPLWLHSSPEYAMKRLLADGWERIFFLGKVFRNGEIARLHNPEFTMLEFYRADRGYEGILGDIEAFTWRAAEVLAGGPRIEWNGASIDLTPPWDRLPVAEAFATRAGIELPLDGDAELLRARARERGFDLPSHLTAFDDVFFAIFLVAVEPGLGSPRPTFLVDWPASMASSPSSATGVSDSSASITSPPPVRCGYRRSWRRSRVNSPVSDWICGSSNCSTRRRRRPTSRSMWRPTSDGPPTPRASSAGH